MAIAFKKKKKNAGKNKPSKVKSSGMSAKDKMIARKKRFESSGDRAFLFLKEGTERVRILHPGADEEIALEIYQFFFKGIGSIISPRTFGESCPIYDKWEELKNSDDDTDVETAKLISPKKKYIVCVCGTNKKGDAVDPDKFCKLLGLGKQAYQDLIELYLDEDEWGDPSDPVEGYDIKLTKSGSGMNTNYTVSPCSKRPLKKISSDKPIPKEIDLEEMVRKQILPYEELENTMEKYLSSGIDDDEDDHSKKNRKDFKNNKKKRKSKKKRSRDFDDDDLPF